MIGGVETNPLSLRTPIRRAVSIAAELPTFLAAKLNAQGGITCPESWVEKAVTALLESGVFSEGHQTTYCGYVGSGNGSRCYKFRTDGRDYVLKIGKDRPKTHGYPNPSTIEYARWYKFVLDRLVAAAQENGLPYFIPQPQYVMFLSSENHTNRNPSRTAIAMPYYERVTPFSQLGQLNQEVRRGLSEELISVRRCFAQVGRLGILPDLVQPTNYVVAECQDGRPHFVALDCEMKDKKAASPISHIFNQSMARYRLGVAEREIGVSFRRKAVRSFG